MGPQCRLGVHVGFVSPSIIRDLKHLTGEIFKARFEYCYFDENIFTSLGRKKVVARSTTRNRLE
jgi:hypothetical protein